MSTEQIKSEIRKLIEHVPDTILEKILEYLKEASSGSGLKKLEIIENIFEKDKNLLKRLSE